MLATARTDAGDVPSTTALVQVLHEQFGVAAHPRSVERSLLRYAERREKKLP